MIILRSITWSAFAWFGVTVLATLATWQFTAYYYRKHWLMWVSDKARDVVLEIRRKLAEAEQTKQRLEAEVAELRGMVEGARLRLERPRQLELIERVGMAKQRNA